MVGGLAESDIIYRAVKFEFASGLQIYRPEDADLVVLKGAVHLGLDPLAVMSRISRFTYGIRVFEVFDHRIHLEEKMVQRNGRYVCKDVYSKKFTIGETVEVGSVTQFKVFDTFIPDREDKRVDPLRVEIYVSELKEPRYTTDDTCKKLCSIIIEPYDDKWPVTVKGLVTFEVARSELIATFRDINTQRTAKCKFDFM
ncbi:hypothetical protein FSP39_006592 [Pinctada imbricata]|uniref:Uncharacterized protein n=1 Tax=Pinctada imbricata TaxID=66713 RepID=A0AA89BJ63_PINIB|nr:hypothetical protein FSP39_006592 [Pinctada imbricata]